MKKLLFIVLVIPIIFLDYGCENNSTEPCDQDTSTAIARKPNLYLYPNETMLLSVEINFPKGGKIIESIPKYNDSWNISVESNGKINGTYDYLFYECEIPDLTQKENGWVIKTENLKEFFSSNLEIYGFNHDEINDFTEYWIPILKDYDYYEIYPQYKSTLDRIVKIEFSVEPENYFRLFYVIIGRNDKHLELSEPIMESANRENFYSVEWGVIID